MARSTLWPLPTENRQRTGPIDSGQVAKLAGQGHQISAPRQADPEIASRWQKSTTITSVVSQLRVRNSAMLAKLRRDPSLIAVFDFEADELPVGEFQTVRSRWTGNRAAEFVIAGQRMQIDVGGDKAGRNLR